MRSFVRPWIRGFRHYVASTGAVSTMASGKAQLPQVLNLLDTRVSLLQVETKRSNLASTASGLRAWHSCAVEVLDYPASHSLPPRSSLDACRFVVIFKNAGTAANYLNYVRWACRYCGVDIDWWDDSVKAVLKGARMEYLRMHGGAALAQFLLTDDIIGNMSGLAHNLGDPALQCFVLLSSVFLLRVQSEGIHLQKGRVSELASLPNGRHSAMCIDGNTLHIRLARRKNRPTGSWLRRDCSCQVSSPI